MYIKLTGINSFGFGGANCHILLASNNKLKAPAPQLPENPKIIYFSGRSKEAVDTLCQDIKGRRFDPEFATLVNEIFK